MTPSLEEIETPAAVVDVARMRGNLQRAAEYCRKHGLAWRPHVKTHKTPELAREQLRAGAIGVTVATPRETEIMSAVVDDILLAYPPVGAAKLARLMRLPPELRLTVGLDSAAALEGLATAARTEGREVGVLVEIDAGMGRVGVQTPREAVELAVQAAQTEGVAYRGITFYPGQVRGPVAEQGLQLRTLSRAAGRVPRDASQGGVLPRNRERRLYSHLLALARDHRGDRSTSRNQHLQRPDHSRDRRVRME